MPTRILHAPTRAAYAAAPTQQEQCEAVRDAFSGNVTVRIEGAGGQHLRTMTLGPFTVNSATPRGIACGAVLADTAVAPNTPGAAGIAPVRWEFRNGSTPIFETSDIVQGPIRTLCAPRFGAVVFTADSVLPAVPLDARISFWGQSNAEGSALRSGISAITADPTLVAWDNGTNTFPRVRFWNGTAYAQYVPGSNHGTTSTLLGPEFGMAVRWMRETTTGVLYMDKAAWGGTSIDLFQPPSAARWNDSISRRNAQNAWLTANGVSIDPSRTFWLWSQAEADSGQSQSWYQPRMQAIVDAIEANGILPFRGVLTDIPTGSPRFNSGISAAKQVVADTTGGLLVRQIEPAFPAFFEADNLHLNARGQVQRSYTAYSFFFDAATITV
jgi:hypothetical protein